ncbi:MAG: hypothetical protein FJ100_08395 [Deltaproteobacteria bacterium]|nr:hypothetical protein [Deltaproteobacteria bacterium]
MAVSHYGFVCRVTQVDTSGPDELVYFLVEGAGSTEYRVRWANPDDMMTEEEFINGGGELPEGYDYLTDTVDDVGILLVTVRWLGDPADPDISSAIIKYPPVEPATEGFAHRYAVVALGPMVQVVTQAELDARPPAGKGPVKRKLKAYEVARLPSHEAAGYANQIGQAFGAKGELRLSETGRRAAGLPPGDRL